MTLPVQVPIVVGGCTLSKRAKYLVEIDGETHYCISANHVAELLKLRGHNIKASDIYSFGCEERRTPTLMKRWPDMKLQKMSEDARRKRRVQPS